ncbi:hrp65 protein [Frankliniella occidentalis]|uniref:Hrp65 protein n=1 Tax=Frankliniella occidentalis TaxID=133901 RepID=A0A6J1SEY5_FRAOC|nr:hrp65 protein [Frankliniella occidentalis]
MAAPNAEVKPDVAAQNQQQQQQQGKPEGSGNFHGGHGGRGGGGSRGGPGGRRFSGPGRDHSRGSRGGPGGNDMNSGNRSSMNSPGNRGGAVSTPGNRGGPPSRMSTGSTNTPKVKSEADDNTPNRMQNSLNQRPRGVFRGGPNRDDRPRGGQEDRFNEKLSTLAGPTHDLPPLDLSEKKFSGKNRLYIGNLTNDVTEEEITSLFQKFGETSELFVNKEKNFAFIRMDFHVNAEKAKRELDGSMRKGRPLKVRFAPNSTAVKVKNLTPYVTNELLDKAFCIFGDIERAVIITDERGKSTGEGIVEFARKPGAQMALRRCSEGCFFLTSSLRPVILEPIEQLDDIDGYSEKVIPKKSSDYMKAREVGPRFASPGSFEYEYGTRWKQMYERRKQKEEALQREMKMEEEKLEAQMEYAKYEHETEMLREQLRQRELDRERQKRDWELKERQAEEQRRQDEEIMRRQQEDMSMRMHHQEEELRRRQQENSLFMQAHQLSSLLDQQEQAMGNRGNYESPQGGDAPMRDYDAAAGQGQIPSDPKAFMDAYERGGRYDNQRGDMMDDMANGGGRNRSRWGAPERARVDDYQAKRRRF